MTSFLFTVVLLAQVQLGNGTVSGVLQDVTGNPIANVRVALAEVSYDATNQGRPGSVLVSLTTTGALGAYRLENVPPGRYFIVSGRVDRPTYYPGTVDSGNARIVSISSGAVMIGMNFVINAESLQSASSGKSSVGNLPLVGRNVLDLIRVLGASNQPLIFSFESVNGRILNFKAADGSPLRHDCFGATISQPPKDCSFHISEGGVNGSYPDYLFGVGFRFKDGGRELEFTCQAAQCKVEIGGFTPVTRTFKIRESGSIATSSTARFTVTP